MGMNTGYWATGRFPFISIFHETGDGSVENRPLFLSDGSRDLKMQAYALIHAEAAGVPEAIIEYFFRLIFLLLFLAGEGDCK